VVREAPRRYGSGGMKEDRLFRVIVLGGLALVGSPACGRGAMNGSALGDDGPSPDGDLPSELRDAHDDVIGVSTIGSEGGPNDLVRVAPDANGDEAGGPGDADLAGDVTSDAQECGFESFPAETAIATCSGRCVPAGCPCAAPSGCSCLNCANAGTSDSGGP
jgi:hypothetical protein